jgi:hypothetical protein
MLDAHPEIAVPAETHFLVPVSRLAGEGEALRREFFRTVTEFPTWEDFELPKDAFWEQLAEIDPFTLPDACRCFYRWYASRSNKTRGGDKSPPYCLHLDAVERVLPEAHFIHLIRDGRDVAVSLRGLWFAPGNDMESLARHWRQSILTARQLARNCRHYLEVRYEDLLANTHDELNRICRFIDVRYHEGMERYYVRARQRLDEVKTRHRADGTVLITKDQRLFLHRLTSQKPDCSRAGRWQRELSREERAQFEAVAGDLLSECGYLARAA